MDRAAIDRDRSTTPCPLNLTRMHSTSLVAEREIYECAIEAESLSGFTWIARSSLRFWRNVMKWLLDNLVKVLKRNLLTGTPATTLVTNKSTLGPFDVDYILF